jgi:cysteinyl-tRNA synthetase
VQEAAFAMDRVLGLRLRESLEATRSDINNEENSALTVEVEALIAKRAAAKKAGDYAASDAIRDDLKARGIILEDSKSGTTWRRY